jgi:hypothetical protein
MTYLDNLKYSLGIKNYYQYSPSFFIINLVLIYMASSISAFFNFRLIQNTQSELFNLVNTDIFNFILINNSNIIYTYILFYIFLVILCSIFFIFSKFSKSDIDFKKAIKIIYPFGSYYFFISLIMILSNFQNVFIYMFFILSIIFLSIIFFTSLVKQFSYVSGLTKLSYYMFLIASGGIVTLLILLL